MKTYFLIFLLLLSPLVIFAQETNTRDATVSLQRDKGDDINLGEIKFILEGMSDESIKQYFENCVSNNQFFFYIGGDPVPRLLLDEKDWDFVKAFPQFSIISIQYIGRIEEGKKFNTLMLDYLKNHPDIVSRRNIIYVASNKAREVGYKIEGMDVIYDYDNKKWMEYLTLSGTLPEQYPLLNGKNYQTVYFSPKGNVKGGDLWVFVDKDTNGIITYIGGE